MSDICQSPILFIIFNRPETTRRVFQAIRKARPSRLYISGDGPRENVPDDSERVQKCREIVDRVDWDCSVYTHYQNQNLGCGKAVSSALDWFFENETMGVILEDDCLPAETFFRYCDTLLMRYRDNPEVMQISGYNLLGNAPIESSYYFSRVGSVWGWATWLRAWKHYQHEIDSSYFDERFDALSHFWTNKREKQIRRRQFLTASQVNTWDYQWLFTRCIQSGLTIVPKINLVENIGFGQEGTHTKATDDPRAIPASNLGFPLKHPESVIAEASLDKLSFQKAYPVWNDLKSRLMRLIRNCVPSGFKTSRPEKE